VFGELDDWALEIAVCAENFLIEVIRVTAVRIEIRPEGSRLDPVGSVR
jgi:hypothetical protein